MYYFQSLSEVPDLILTKSILSRHYLYPHFGGKEIDKEKRFVNYS